MEGKWTAAMIERHFPSPTVGYTPRMTVSPATDGVGERGDASSFLCPSSVEVTSPRELQQFPFQSGPVDAVHLMPIYEPSYIITGQQEFAKTDQREDALSACHSTYSLSAGSPAPPSNAQRAVEGANPEALRGPVFHPGMVSPPPPPSDRWPTPEPSLPAVRPAKGKRRNNVHRMAIMRHLITDQDPHGIGSVELSSEESRTLVQVGYPTPTQLPLTEGEKHALKIVRRKIKNKLSAQESRRRHKEYVEALERETRGYHNENTALKAKVCYLEQCNQGLMMQLEKARSLNAAKQGAASSDYGELSM